MFLLRRPTFQAIDRFLARSEAASLSYGETGIVAVDNGGATIDRATTLIGHGQADFVRARAALAAWAQFDLGWVEAYPRRASIDVGTTVAVLIRHCGFWSLNGCRVLYHTGDDNRFGFAYGTLTNHAESGEELFEVFIEPQSNDVFYRIRATSSPQTLLASVGQPIVRSLQARFRVDSSAAMKRAVSRP